MAGSVQMDKWTEGLTLDLPGVDFEPGFCVRPRALITSTSSCPFLSTMPICMSPETKHFRLQI